MQVDENTIIGDILDADKGCEEVFLSMGMTCMSCPASRGETVGEACEIHGIDTAELLAGLRAKMQE